MARSRRHEYVDDDEYDQRVRSDYANRTNPAGTFARAFGGTTGVILGILAIPFVLSLVMCVGCVGCTALVAPRAPATAIKEESGPFKPKDLHPPAKIDDADAKRNKR